MPTLPTVPELQQPIGVPRKPAGNAWGELEQVFKGAGEVFANIQAGADAAERTKLTGEGSANMSAALADAKIQYPDPEEYRANAPAAVQQAYDAALAKATNSKNRRAVEASLANDLIAARQHTLVSYFEKKKDVANAGYVDSLDQTAKQAILEPDPDKRNEILKKITPLLGERVASGYMKHEEAAKDALKLLKDVEAGRMELSARQTPEKFSEDVEKGVWKTADGVAVQRALDIAGKVSDAKARRDATAGKVQDDENYRGFEQQAEARKLDLNDLESKAARWGWDKNKVDRLKNMQMGLRSANPNEAKLIFETMRPVSLAIRPTEKQINDTDNALNRLAQDRSLSVDSVEFRGAKENLRSLARSISIQGDIKDRETKFDANSAVHNLYNKFYPGPKDERMSSEIADHILKIAKMPQQDRKPYIDTLEKKLEKDRAGKVGLFEVIQGLRGIK